MFVTDNKSLDEVPPIPGYKGFIPHVRTSDVGLGSRFHNMAREGYDALYAQKSEYEDQKALQSDVGTVEPEPTASAARCTTYLSHIILRLLVNKLYV